MGTSTLPSYVLITPAHNEAATLEKTVQSIANQNHKPNRWIIVSDGSVDQTDAIAQAAIQKHHFIHFLRREKDHSRNFASKVYAIQAGLHSLNGNKYDFIGFMDADITLELDFFASLLERMSANPQHGLGGGGVFERRGEKWALTPSNYDMSVAGAMQMFRRECFEQIGGYLPLPYGGIDMIAEASARMHGWKVQSFTDLKVFHHHAQGRTHGNWYRALFKRGRMEYVNGYHPLFQCLRFVSWIPQRPILLASFIRTLGYCYAALSKEPFAVPSDVRNYMRKEQMGRFKQLFKLN